MLFNIELQEVVRVGNKRGDVSGIIVIHTCDNVLYHTLVRQRKGKCFVSLSKFFGIKLSALFDIRS
jgi:hypothetical protein